MIANWTKYNEYALSLVLQQVPTAASLGNGEGQLPLEIAIMHGWKLSVLMELVNAHPESLNVVSTIGLPPFAIAAIDDKCDIATVYTLLNNNPSVLKCYATHF